GRGGAGAVCTRARGLSRGGVHALPVQRVAKRRKPCFRGGRSLRAKARRSLPPRERSRFARSGERLSPQASRSPVRATRADLPKRPSDGGEPCRTRTYNLEIKSLLLYQLS